MMKRGMDLLLKSGVFILILASSDLNFLNTLRVWGIETAFLLILFIYGAVQKKLVKGRFYRYNMMVFSFLMAAGLMYFSSEIFNQGSEKFSRLFAAMFLNYYMFLSMKNGIKDLASVSSTFIAASSVIWVTRMLFMHFPEPILFFNLPPGIIFSFALAIIVFKVIGRRER